MTAASTGISFIVPAYNESGGIAATLEALNSALKGVGRPYEIVVVDDGSSDDTAERARAAGATVISHPVNTGYGSAIKTGILWANYDWIGIVDADGTYEIALLPELVAAMDRGFDMAVASRGNVLDLDSAAKRLFRRALIAFLNLAIAARIQDPNSGFRIFRKELATTFFPFLCNTFSFTTSLTLFALGEGYFVKYVPTRYGARRSGRSKVRRLRDSLRMAQLVLQGITFFNPLKFYVALTLLLVLFVGLPAVVLAVVGFGAVAVALALIGSAAAVLVGIGVLSDIVRISTTARINKKGSLLEPRDGAGDR